MTQVARAGGATTATTADEIDAAPQVVLKSMQGDWQRGEARASARSQLFRRQLGLETERPIVMSGHQAQFWHPGILAKFAVARVLAAKQGAQAVWLVVDQDANRPDLIEYPARGDDGSLTRRVWSLWGNPTQGSGEIPASQRGASACGSVPDDAAWEGIGEGLGRIGVAMNAAAEAASAAEQVTKAMCAELQRSLGTSHDPVQTLYATSIAQTDLFREIVETMRRDPLTCAQAYNDGVAAHPDSGLRALTINEETGRIELPLWHLQRGVPRRAVYATDLDSVEIETLAPRAILMTGLLRLAGCDLFVHGLGGEAYEPVADAWLGAWLGECALAPVGIASATLLLRAGGEWTDGEGSAALPSEAEVAEATHSAQKARHDPALVGDDARAARKQELLTAIEQAKEAGEKPGALFKQMQSLLEEHREANADAIEGLERQSEHVKRRWRDREVLGERTWAFPLYDDDQLRDLVARIERELG